MGSNLGMKDTEKWARSIYEYELKRQNIYEPYTKKLQTIFTHVAEKYSPLITVEARTKSIGSFTEKVLRKKEKYSDPLKDITDICGVRIITNTLDERDIICKYIEDNFVIDRENSLDLSQRLKSSEFGYRSIHYIVQAKIDNNILSKEELNQFKALKAEIQVRTLAEHLFAEYIHDVVKAYKLPHKIPEKITCEMANVAAMLEKVDESLLKTKIGIESYTSYYSNSSEIGKIQEEIATLKNVLENKHNVDKTTNLDLVSLISKHAKPIHEWDTIIDILEE